MRYERERDHLFFLLLSKGSSRLEHRSTSPNKEEEQPVSEMGFYETIASKKSLKSNRRAFCAPSEESLTQELHEESKRVEGSRNVVKLPPITNTAIIANS